MLIVLTIVCVALIGYTTSGQQADNYSSARVMARSLAESGVNLGLATLEAAVDPTSSSALPTAGSPGVQTNSDGGAAYWWGSYDSASSTWTVTGKGVVRNPSAGGSIYRTASEQATVTYSSLWLGFYSDGGNGCTTITSNVVLSAPLYVNGPLCLQQNAVIKSSTLQVNGTVTLLNNSTVGQSGTPITQANITGGCSLVTGGPYTSPCSSSQRVYASTVTTTGGTATKPAVNLSYWYQNAQPGPMHNCTGGSVPGGFDTDTTMNRSLSTFTLTPAGSYTCTVTSGGTTVGQLTWNSGTKTLTVSGTIFFDGNIYLTSGTYQGRGTIYSSGTISIDGTSKFCGIAACDATWNPSTNLITFVAGSSTDTYGFTITQNAVYQAATYVVNDYQQTLNARNWGPVIARSISVQNNAPVMQPVNAFPGGTPGAIVTPVAGSYDG